jgi:hypothetical protein
VGEVRVQFHVVTDGHDQMEPQIKAFLDTMNKYGHEGVRLFWTDNAAADFDFFTRVIPSLVTTQQGLNNIHPASTMPSNDELPLCSVAASRYQVVTRDADINLKLHTLCDTVKALPLESRVLSLDAEWDTTKGRNGLVSGSGRVALIQISYQIAADGEIFALLIRVHGRTHLPAALVTLLQDPEFTFTGRNIGGDIKKLGDDFKCSHQLANINIVELGKMARERDVVHSGAVGLDTIVRKCLSERLVKPPSVRLSVWSAATLTADQIQYAALDAIKALEVYLKLVKMPNLAQRLSSKAPTGTLVDIVPSHGAVHVMATRAGTGEIIAHDAEWTLPPALHRTRKPRGDMHLVKGVPCECRITCVRVCALVR